MRALLLTVAFLTLSTDTVAGIVTLYQPDQIVRKCVGVQVALFADYVKQITNVSSETFIATHPGNSTSYSLIVGVRPTGLVKMWLVSGQNEILRATKEKMIKSAMNIYSLSVNCKILLFSTNVEIGNGGIPFISSENPVAIPNVWKKYANEGDSEVGSLAIKTWDMVNID